ncbi:hypothetical protein L596_025576 [Steinernema carpocapsae]|uniref:Uncharacterized protein n=1 Tax=Steinernema carpocapsae TaxID=34508 RepID=A0A4U5M8Z8_STECR|nr:hypothetical protein L596_025576 [Steinernema carpocapsae]
MVAHFILDVFADDERSILRLRSCFHPFSSLRPPPESDYTCFQRSRGRLLGFRCSFHFSLASITFRRRLRAPKTMCFAVALAAVLDVVVTSVSGNSLYLTYLHCVVVIPWTTTIATILTFAVTTSAETASESASKPIEDPPTTFPSPFQEDLLDMFALIAAYEDFDDLELTFMQQLLERNWQEEIRNTSFKDWIHLIVMSLVIVGVGAGHTLWILSSIEPMKTPENREYDTWRDKKYEEQLEGAYNKALEDKKRYDAYEVYKRKKDDERKQDDNVDEFGVVLR